MTPEREAGIRELLTLCDGPRADMEDAIADLLAALDEARRERDVLRAEYLCAECQHNRAEVERLTRERDEAREDERILRARWQSSRVSLRSGTLVAERDRLAAALAEVRRLVDSERSAREHFGESLPGGTIDQIHRALAATPADLADAHDRRVRAEALRDAAERYALPAADGGGSWADVRAWLRAEADRVERGGR